MGKTLNPSKRVSLPPLPEVEGPRLDPFPTRRGQEPDIEFLEHLGTGYTAHVFKARVDGQIFALKIFKWATFNKHSTAIPKSYHDRIDESVVVAHIHPFYSECRAYGRLKELDKEHLAGRCYGYFFLSAAQEDELQEKLGTFQWKNEETVGERNGAPLQVLVKEFIPGKVLFDPKDARLMVRNLKALHRCGIFVMDIKEEAYINGILVDFSHAWTIPNYHFDPELGFDPQREGGTAVWSDLGNLEAVFREWDDEPQNTPKIPVRVLPDWKRVATLRDQRARHLDLYNSYDPTKFDWRKASRLSREEKSTRPAGKPTGVAKRRGKPIKSAREKTPGHKKTQRKRAR